jgi:hypothetical protein
MAMRWSSSERRRHAPGAAALLLAACVTTVTRSFVPSPRNPRYTTATAAPVLAEYVRLQCPGFRQAQRPDSGTARLAVDADSAGVATRSELVRGTGDEMLDGVFGTVAAQLTFPRDTGEAAPRIPARGGRIPVDIAWRCVGDRAVVRLRPAPER